MSEGDNKQTMAGVLGEVVWLMHKSPSHRQVLIAELDWLVMQPILLNQYRIYHKEGKPVGVVFWASVDDDTAQRLGQGKAKLRNHEWKSGSNYWIVDVLAPFGNAQYFVDEMANSLFSGKVFSYLQTAADGTQKIVEVNAGKPH